jgi:hypothetical protein
LKLYRADKRDFNVGTEISTAREFIIKNPQGSHRVEDLFEFKRPSNKPMRSESLFLFENLEVAKKHWSEMIDGNLYEVEVDNSSILHRADMQLVDLAFRTENESELERCAADYWMGKETNNPRIEVLVKKAIISNVISKSQSERREYFKSWALA